MYRYIPPCLDTDVLAEAGSQSDKETYKDICFISFRQIPTRYDKVMHGWGWLRERAWGRKGKMPIFWGAQWLGRPAKLNDHT